MACIAEIIGLRCTPSSEVTHVNTYAVCDILFSVSIVIDLNQRQEMKSKLPLYYTVLTQRRDNCCYRRYASRCRRSCDKVGKGFLQFHR